MLRIGLVFLALLATGSTLDLSAAVSITPALTPSAHSVSQAAMDAGPCQSEEACRTIADNQCGTNNYFWRGDLTQLIANGTTQTRTFYLTFECADDRISATPITLPDGGPGLQIAPCGSPAGRPPLDYGIYNCVGFAHAQCPDGYEEHGESEIEPNVLSIAVRCKVKGQPEFVDEGATITAP